MANLTNRLCNPTPFLAEIRWHAGIVIKVDPDSHVDLVNKQMEDFQPGLPGSATVRETMDHFGLFLRDHDRSYESQALQGIRASIKTKSNLLEVGTQELRKTRGGAGIHDTESQLQDILNRLGYGKLATEIETLRRREAFLSKHVEAEKKPLTPTQKFDPERTLLFMDPPRQFPSKVSMMMFLEENPDLKVRYEEQAAAQEEVASAPRRRSV